MSDTTKTITATEFAAKIGTDARTARRYLRKAVGKAGNGKGKGARHAIPASEVGTLRKGFKTWHDADQKARAEAKAAKATATAE